MPVNIAPQEYLDGVGEEIGRDQLCLPTAIRALNILMENGFMVVEYGNQILFRHGKKELCENPEWLLRDEDVRLASDILAQEYPRVRPPERPWVGYWDSRARCHSIKMPELGLNFGVIYLLPMSAVGLHVNDTVRVASALNRYHIIHSPEPVAYIASLISKLRTFETTDTARFRVQSDLLHFICYRILRIQASSGPGIIQRNSEQRERITTMAFATSNWPWQKMEASVYEIAKKIIAEPQHIWQLAPDPPAAPVMFGPPNYPSQSGSLAPPISPAQLVPFYPSTQPTLLDFHASVVGPEPTPRPLLSAPLPPRTRRAFPGPFDPATYNFPPPAAQFSSPAGPVVPSPFPSPFHPRFRLGQSSPPATTPELTLHPPPASPASVGPAFSPDQLAPPAADEQSLSELAMPAHPAPPA
ncbi:hypothetical protein N7454_010658 [Penicillium verhagenii]|nr:hypothetical protein N7454_010658 [Penicillium verhagenii]